MDNEATNIAHLLKKGSAEGFRKTALTYGPRIYAIAFEIIGNRADAEEVTSDALMQVFRNIDSFQPEKGTLTGWILRIAHNCAISALRRRKPEEATVEITENIPTADETENYEVTFVKEAINRCSPKERTLIQLYYYDNLPLTEISGILDVAAPTLAVRLQRIRQKIKQYIRQNNGR